MTCNGDTVIVSTGSMPYVRRIGLSEAATLRSRLPAP